MQWVLRVALHRLFTRLSMITRLSLLYLTHANKWHSPSTGNLGEDPIPFIYSPEIGLYLSKLYKVRRNICLLKPQGLCLCLCCCNRLFCLNLYSIQVSLCL